MRNIRQQLFSQDEGKTKIKAIKQQLKLQQHVISLTKNDDNIQLITQKLFFSLCQQNQKLSITDFCASLFCTSIYVCSCQITGVQIPPHTKLSVCNYVLRTVTVTVSHVVSRVLSIFCGHQEDASNLQENLRDRLDVYEQAYALIKPLWK